MSNRKSKDDTAFKDSHYRDDKQQSSPAEKDTLNNNNPNSKCCDHSKKYNDFD